MVRVLVKRLMMAWQVLRHRDDAPKVVFYHDIGRKYTPMGTPVERFEAQMAWLREGLGGLGGLDGLGGHVVAFDDGFRGIWDARSRLKVEVDRGLEIIVFIAVGLVGQPGYLTWDEIRELQRNYGVNFQCHTWSHQTLVGDGNPDLPEPDDPNFRTEAWYRHELVDSKAELERQLNIGLGGLGGLDGLGGLGGLDGLGGLGGLDGLGGAGGDCGGRCRKVVDSICFPVGNFSEDVIRRCKEAGYRKAYASYPGNITDEYVQPRNIVQDCSLSDFKLVLKGGLMAFQDRYYRRHWVNV